MPRPPLLPPPPLPRLPPPPLPEVGGGRGTRPRGRPRSLPWGETVVATATVVAGEPAGPLPPSLLLPLPRWSVMLLVLLRTGTIMVAPPPLQTRGQVGALRVQPNQRRSRLDYHGGLEWWWWRRADGGREGSRSATVPPSPPTLPCPPVRYARARPCKLPRLPPLPAHSLFGWLMGTRRGGTGTYGTWVETPAGLDCPTCYSCRKLKAGGRAGPFARGGNHAAIAIDPSAAVVGRVVELPPSRLRVRREPPRYCSILPWADGQGSGFYCTASQLLMPRSRGRPLQYLLPMCPIHGSPPWPRLVTGSISPLSCARWTPSPACRASPGYPWPGRHGLVRPMATIAQVPLQHTCAGRRSSQLGVTPVAGRCQTGAQRGEQHHSVGAGEEHASLRASDASVHLATLESQSCSKLSFIDDAGQSLCLLH